VSLLSDTLKDKMESYYFLDTTINLEDMYRGVLIFVMIIAILFSIPVTYLVCVQTKNYMLNKTTSMRLSKYRRSRSFDQTMSHLEYSKID
jgi:hypothetical protein